MKKLSVWLMVLSLGVFAIGCGEQAGDGAADPATPETTPETPEATPPAGEEPPPADTGDAAASTEEDGAAATE